MRSFYFKVLSKANKEDWDKVGDGFEPKLIWVPFFTDRVGVYIASNFVFDIRIHVDFIGSNALILFLLAETLEEALILMVIQVGIDVLPHSQFLVWNGEVINVFAINGGVLLMHFSFPLSQNEYNYETECDHD